MAGHLASAGMRRVPVFAPAGAAVSGAQEPRADVIRVALTCDERFLLRQDVRTGVIGGWAVGDDPALQEIL